MTNKMIDQYLSQLRAELSSSDKAIIQDALADAEEHLRTALESESQDPADEEAIQNIIESYGTPEEIADAYKAVEIYARPTLATSMVHQNGNVMARFFGVYADPRAWGALLYMLISLLTGVIYFTWAVTGISLAIPFALFIFGLPFVVLFDLSIKGIGLLEGRIVEALLGVRMPRRSVFWKKDLSWMQRLKLQLLDKYTWLGLLYMLLQLVFGVLYFTVFVTLIAISLAFMAIPIVQLVFEYPTIQIASGQYFVPYTLLPVAVLLGFMLLTSSLHLARQLGKLHGRYAKFMLVGE
ncbi:MAG: sensor domain-containing protein [Anaerolineales bacterium]|nr:sensor domain-containing protein [Chloroflexota bacterium]MBL6979656.1 sensor domain-containing protein [Anaerolineales bacterium]